MPRSEPLKCFKLEPEHTLELESSIYKYYDAYRWPLKDAQTVYGVALCAQMLYGVALCDCTVATDVF